MPCRGSAWEGEDHPRSRGVYDPCIRGTGRTEGSSPLARGLRAVKMKDFSPMRIIPARAGFTLARSLMRTIRTGSSPLARGLPSRRASTLLSARIIPARAGFTWCCVWRWPGPWDHPRSRGVYAWTVSGLDCPGGSSPLARGLLDKQVEQLGCRGIIPARAGFTLADPWNPNEPVLYQTPVAFTADLGPARRVVVAPPRQE